MYKNKLINYLHTITLGCLAVLSGCATVAESTNFLSDEDAVSQSAGALGYPTNELSLISRRTEGTNTYLALKADDGKEFSCILNGGNLLSMGIVNPPMCAKKGEPIKAPFQ